MTVVTTAPYQSQQDTINHSLFVKLRTHLLPQYPVSPVSSGWELPRFGSGFRVPRENSSPFLCTAWISNTNPRWNPQKSRKDAFLQEEKKKRIIIITILKKKEEKKTLTVWLYRKSRARGELCFAFRDETSELTFSGSKKIPIPGL